jgi:hypothetical protein
VALTYAQCRLTGDHEEYTMHKPTRIRSRVNSGILALAIASAAVGCSPSGSDSDEIGQTGDELKGGMRGGGKGKQTHGKPTAQAGSGADTTHGQGNAHAHAGHGNAADHGGQAGTGHGKGHGQAGHDANDQDSQTDETK